MTNNHLGLPNLVDESEPPDIFDTTAQFTQEHQKALFNGFRGTSEYTFDTHRIQLPICADEPKGKEPTCVVIKTANTTGKRVVHYRAERFGEWPILPEAKDTFNDENGIKYTLLDVSLTPENLVPVNGQFKYRIDAVYTYAMSRPAAQNERLRTVTDPRITAASQHNFTSTSGKMFTGGSP